LMMGESRPSVCWGRAHKRQNTNFSLLYKGLQFKIRGFEIEF